MGVPPVGEEEFAAFVEVSWAQLVRVAAAIAGGREAGEDAVQVALARMWVRWPSIAVRARLAYARRSVVNAVLATGRRQSSKELVTALPPERAGTEDLGLRVGESDAIARALSALGPRARAVVVLRHMCDLGVAEVAELLGISEGAVKSMNAKAIARLRAELKPEVGQP